MEYLSIHMNFFVSFLVIFARFLFLLLTAVSELFLWVPAMEFAPGVAWSGHSVTTDTPTSLSFNTDPEHVALFNNSI